MMTENILPFQTTMYSPDSNKESSVNYLGLNEYIQRDTVEVFPQFTVLTNNPREHGILCAIYLYLQNNNIGITPESFRDLESFLGLLLSAHNDIASPINVTKYKKVLSELDEVSLKDVKKYRSIYNRLGYGIMGFYINPSVKWKLVNDNKKTLTEIGEDLGGYFLSELGLGKLFDQWLEGKTFRFVDLRNNALKFRIDLPADQLGNEKQLWEQVLQNYLSSISEEIQPFVHIPWKVDISSQELQPFLENSGKYQSFYQIISNLYMYTPLQNKILSYQSLERIMAITEFIFDLEYLSQCQYQSIQEKTTDLKDFKIMLISELILEKESYIKLSGKKDVGLGVIDILPANYDQFLKALIIQHEKIQDDKGKTIYLDSSRNVVIGEIPPDRVESILKASEDKRLQEIFFQYSRDFHFSRFQKYYKYMG